MNSVGGISVKIFHAHEQGGLDLRLSKLEKQIKSENARMVMVKNEVNNAANKVAALSSHKASTFALSGIEEVILCRLNFGSYTPDLNFGTGQATENESRTSCCCHHKGL